MPERAKVLVCRAADRLLEPLRHRGMRQRRLLTENDSAAQNVILVESEMGAEVEMHEIHTSESIFVLEGTFDLLLADRTERLGANDLAHCEAGSLHGLRCTDGPGRCLVVFAPSRLRKK